MPSPFTRAEKMACAQREANMRRRVYKGRVADGRMTQAGADREIALMEVIAADYAEEPQPDLFGASQDGAPG